MVAAARTQHKRHGKHQRRSKDFKKVYWPYIPLVVIISLGIVFSAAWQPRLKQGVLAYATNVSVSGLLSATNQKRAANGVASLSLSTALDNAAQAKANDMVKRNYWSHNTPDGNPPWIFIDQSGYDYKSAGENLAYGFLTSTDTVNGWMDSPPHKENLLNSTFTQVGFGYANSSNYVGDGKETVIVAFYASPASAPLATTSTSGQTEGASTTATPAPTKTKKKKATKPAEKKTPAKDSPVTTASTLAVEPDTHSVSRLAALTAGSVPWLASFASFALLSALALFVMRHAIAVHKWIRRGERYMLHHAIFDITVISLIGLLVIVSQTAGFIR